MCVSSCVGLFFRAPREKKPRKEIQESLSYIEWLLASFRNDWISWLSCL